MQVITDQVLAFSKDNAPCATAQPGEVLLFKTQDCFAGRIPNEDVTMKDLNFSYGFTNPAAGPVYIEGAERPTARTSSTASWARTAATWTTS